MLAALAALALVVSPGAVPSAAASQTVLDLAFMSGCWRAPIDGGFMEEIYTEAAEGLMLGMTRYVRGESVVDFELTRIERRDDGVFLVPYPRGNPSPAAFRLTRATGEEAMFEAPEHDFPRRVRYRRDGDGLAVRIDDGSDDGRGMEWRLEPAPCPGAR